MSAGLPVVAITTEADVRRCYPAYAELRPHLSEAELVARWHEQSAQGYEVVAVEQDGNVAAAAGFRQLTTMAWGRIVYLDDLVALPAYRGLGLGSALLRHLQDEVVRRGCDALHLDTGYGRHDAHRSYLRNGFDLVCHHLEWKPDAR